MLKIQELKTNTPWGLLQSIETRLHRFRGGIGDRGDPFKVCRDGIAVGISHPTGATTDHLPHQRASHITIRQDAALKEMGNLIMRPTPYAGFLIRGDIGHLLPTWPVRRSRKGEIGFETTGHSPWCVAFATMENTLRQIGALVPGCTLRRIWLEGTVREIHPAPKGLQPAPGKGKPDVMLLAGLSDRRLGKDVRLDIQHVCIGHERERWVRKSRK